MERKVNLQLAFIKYRNIHLHNPGVCQQYHERWKGLWARPGRADSIVASLGLILNISHKMR